MNKYDSCKGIVSDVTKVYVITGSCFTRGRYTTPKFNFFFALRLLYFLVYTDFKYKSYKYVSKKKIVDL